MSTGPPPVLLKPAHFDWFVYSDPNTALHAATKLEHLTGEHCRVERFGLRYRIVRYDNFGREVIQA